MPGPTEFEGKFAIVTGVGQSMGLAMAQRLAAGGARVIVNGLDPQSAERTATELTSNRADALAAPGDVSSGYDVRAL